MNHPDHIFSIQVTGDGSHTIYSDLFDATYHSHHGALQESRHVFIKEGLLHGLPKPRLRILELGFGSGLNAILTLENEVNQTTSIEYTTLEAHPIPLAVLEKLNYKKILPKNSWDLLLRLHKLSWGNTHELSRSTSFIKHHLSFDDFSASEGSFDLVYHDAFAPSCTPHYWESPFLEKLYTWLAPGAILVTFCSKGTFRRALEKVGLTVEKIAGPPGKREMVRAYKK